MSKSKKLDLRSIRHPDCLSCNVKERARLIKNQMCTHLVSVSDNKPVRCVGEWAYDKIYRLMQYFGIFVTGMKAKWEGLCYVEVCSGPGRCVSRENRQEIDGTALAVINHPNFSNLKKALYIDNENKVVEVLRQRIGDLNASATAEAVVGDYFDIRSIKNNLQKIPKNCLSLCLIDPTQCDIPFITVKTIAEELKNVDFIINVAMGTDLTRNVISAIENPKFSKVRKKYETFLGSSDFFNKSEVLESARVGNMPDLRKLFRLEYAKRFSELGFYYSDQKVVEHYYDLLFVTRNKKGIEFWNKACKIGPNLQREMF